MSARGTRPVAIVSGGGGGIGSACALHLADRGCDVAVAWRGNESGAERAAAACREAGTEAITVHADVTDDAACRALAAAAVGRWGRIDVLVNAAGTTRLVDQRDLEALTASDFERILGVNVTGTYQLTRAVAPHLRAAPHASVVNVSSHSGFSGIGSSTAYAASKGALNTLTLALARSLAPEIRVNAVCPGFVDTRWLAGDLPEAELAALCRRIGEVAPLRRTVTAEEVAEAVGWFALGGLSITGQLLVIDGGTHLTVGDPL